MGFARTFLVCLLPLIPGSWASAGEGVLVLVDARAKPGKVEEVIAGFGRSQASCPEWEGCRRFEIGVSESDPNHIVLVEHWDSVAQHKAEHARITGREAFRAFRAMLERDLEFRYLELR